MTEIIKQLKITRDITKKEMARYDKNTNGYARLKKVYLMLTLSIQMLNSKI